MSDALRQHFEIVAHYAQMYEAYNRRGVSPALDEGDKEFGPDASWKAAHYLEVGRDALRLVVQALISNLRGPPASILDFPSGSGRVTRHLRAFFTDARIVASDLYENHVRFCRSHLDVLGVMSKENLAELSFPEPFDLIFCGSLLTHLPEELFLAAVDLFARSLSENGIAVVTLHGRYSDHIQAHKWKYTDDESYAVAATAVTERGFGYVDYHSSFRDSHFNQQDSYGVTLIRPSWLMRKLETSERIRILGYLERGWDNHQDVLVIGRPDVSAG